MTLFTWKTSTDTPHTNKRPQKADPHSLNLDKNDLNSNTVTSQYSAASLLLDGLHSLFSHSMCKQPPAKTAIHKWDCPGFLQAPESSEFLRCFSKDLHEL